MSLHIPPSTNHTSATHPTISIKPLLERLWPYPEKANVTADEIALAISHIFTNQLSPEQMTALLTALHFTGLDRRADVIAKCAAAMRDAAAPVDEAKLREVMRKRGRREGGYRGGLVRIFFRCFGLHSSVCLRAFNGAFLRRSSVSVPQLKGED